MHQYLTGSGQKPCKGLLIDESDSLTCINHQLSKGNPNIDGKRDQDQSRVDKREEMPSLSSKGGF